MTAPGTHPAGLPDSRDLRSWPAEDLLRLARAAGQLWESTGWADPYEVLHDSQRDLLDRAAGSYLAGGQGYPEGTLEWKLAQVAASHSQPAGLRCTVCLRAVTGSLGRHFSYACGWTVDVTYPVPGTFGTDPGYDAILDRLAEQAGAEHLGSGSGFGGRDVQFSIARQSAGEALAALIEEAIPAAAVTVRPAGGE